ncbi:MAG: hypothetical protein KGM42_00770 [Hyphomicrobiales bacterium]|nr:hypothetical protein [Hyphomicrobiales bacterium]
MKSAPVLVRRRSAAQFASFGPPPPRTPGRPDPQAPEELGAGPAAYARLPHIYFYDGNRPADPTFGFIEIEFSLQRRANGQRRLDLYCIGDGHQSGAGLANGNGLQLELFAGDTLGATTAWAFREMSAGRCDPMTFAASLSISDQDYGKIDRVRAPSVTAVCRSNG